FVEDRLNDHGFEDTVVRYNFVPEDFGDGVEPAGEGDVLFVGKLVEQKGPQLVVEAIPEVLEERPDQHFTFLGDGPLRDELEERVRTFGVEDSVEFRGHVPKEEVIARMKGASVVVSPSLWHEPLSRVVIEAQAVGTPVVTTDRGGNGEAVTAEQVFDPATGDMADALKNVLEKDIDMQRPPRTDEVIEEWVKTYERIVE
ncbi:MAG: glycosyltransferase family 4 protein, partial [Candidatus Nanohaloarchaea archaeon]|nr:glycosyltransferase family 4 protein [Candidatus Nanohaloarchaea archaeon]